MRGPGRTGLWIVMAVAVLLVPGAVGVASAGQDGGDPVRVVATGLDGGAGSAIGPDGRLYVTEPISGEVSRVDPVTGAVHVVADCLPPRVVDGLGGAVDVGFLRGTMYVLVTLVGADVGGADVVGLYRVDGPDDCTAVADIGTWIAAQAPPDDDEIVIDVPSGVQFALERHRTGFLVTDGHYNRVLHVRPDGQIREVLRLGNVVPTGLDHRHGSVVLALAGPVPHLPADGEVVAFRITRPDPRVVASGARLLVDAEYDRHHLYALSQGVFPSDGQPGSPASPDTGRLLRVDDGGFDVVAERLDRPTSLELLHGAAYVVTLDGEVWRIGLSDHD